MKKSIFSVLMCVCISLVAAQAQDASHKQLSNKEKVVALLKSIETGDKTPVSYINPQKYIQHNLGVKDGLAGFGEVLSKLPPNSAKAHTVRAFQDGNFVFTHTKYNFFGPKIGFDIFRFENGKIVEHWDNLQEILGPNPSKRSMTDGTTAIKDLDKTAQNKRLAKRFVTDILVKGKMKKLAGYFNNGKYIQHNPYLGDGLAEMVDGLKTMKAQGIVLKYNKIHKVLGEGNFVLVVSEGYVGNKHTSFYDLFRVENGKIAEHWDVIELILPKAKHQHTNGKF